MLKPDALHRVRGAVVALIGAFRHLPPDVVVLFAPDEWDEVVRTYNQPVDVLEGRFAGLPARVDDTLELGKIVLRWEYVC